MGVFGVPVASFGATLGSLGSLWGDFGAPFPPLGVTLGSLGLPWAPFGPPWGPSWLLFGKCLKLTPQGGPKADFSIDVCSGIAGLELIRG